jgi:hypothetical protein
VGLLPPHLLASSTLSESIHIVRGYVKGGMGDGVDRLLHEKRKTAVESDLTSWCVAFLFSPADLRQDGLRTRSRASAEGTRPSPRSLALSLSLSVLCRSCCHPIRVHHCPCSHTLRHGCGRGGGLITARVEGGDGGGGKRGSRHRFTLQQCPSHPLTV